MNYIYEEIGWDSIKPLLPQVVYDFVSELKMLVTQSCPTPWDPMDCGPPGSSIHEILQQEYWSCRSLLQGNLPDPGIESRFPTLQADSLPVDFVKHYPEKCTQLSYFDEIIPWETLEQVYWVLWTSYSM